MTRTYKVPGVYKPGTHLKHESRLMTGVAGFAGFVDPRGKQGGAETPPLFNKLSATGRADDSQFDEPLVLHRKYDFVARFKSGPRSYLLDAVSGFFLNGGARCYV